MTAQQNMQAAAVVTDGPAVVYQLPILSAKLDGPLLVVGLSLIHISEPTRPY